ncbi:hypothetical protein KR222_000401, partial [Zaprionus bogoriensis]
KSTESSAMSSMCSLLLLLGLAIVVAGKLQLPKIPKIQKLKQTSEVLSAQNTVNSKQCFDYFSPQLDAIIRQYESRYSFCVQKFESDSALEDSKWEQPRRQMEISGKTSCTLLSGCSTIVGYVEAFECFALTAAEQSKSMYELSANATQLAIEVEELYKTLDTARAICINNAERFYVQDTTSTYEYLNDCLSGKLELGQPTPGSTAGPESTYNTDT